MFQGPGALADPKAYRAIFFEETQDHLSDVEAILLKIEPDTPCLPELNAIFRAIHSIKGSASMLGCGDIAQMAHLQENLLDILRKQERALESGDVQAMLKAGDVMRGQAEKHRGAIEHAPDAVPAEALLREQLERPRADAKDGASGPVRRRFAVKLGPLEEPIDEGELDMMIAGLAEMGRLTTPAIDNRAGGVITFEVELEGTADDLQSVLALLVAPQLVAIEKIDRDAAPARTLSPAPNAVSEHDEFFVDPDEFRRKREAVLQADDDDGPDDESLVAPVRAASAAIAIEDDLPIAPRETGHIRVATEKIDLLVNLVGELVITEAMLARSVTESGLADLSRHTRNLQEAVMAIRMLPISHAFSRFPRLVHELSARLGKDVDLEFEGESTELDRGLIEKISDPLTHLVRNAVDHGLETPGIRVAEGKSPTGILRLAARQRGGNIVIEVSDDGRGLDRERILEHALLRGMSISPDAPDEDVWDLIFEPGFSTAESVTDLSGRGVGMDVVRRNIKALGGTIELRSEPGQGTSVTVSVPLTLAIIEAMIVSIGGAVYVLPIATVVETLSLQGGDIHTLPDHGDTLRVRETYLPVIHLARIFPPANRSDHVGSIAVIVEADGRQAALVVDEVVGQQQVVVKSLEANFRKVPGLSGATVMGDGSVALILDVAHIVKK
ncbi:MAG TPA: chemotaxis protein CheA [Ramlibacter sp.]|nr:chemotaxis protein CheA [Ramlibacter sp.]